MNAYTWPDGTPKSQNSAFTAHLSDPRSSIQFQAKRGPKPATMLNLRQFAVYAKATPKEL